MTQMTQACVAWARELREEPASHARSGTEAGALSAITDADCSIAIWQRPVDAVVHTRAKAIAASEPLELRLNLTPAQLKHDLLASITAKSFPLGVRDPLLNDIERLGRHFEAIASTLDVPRAVTLRLETLRDDGCRRFHVDRVHLRLLCTYLGPGTEWLTEDQVDRDALATHLPNEAILRRGVPQRLEPFWVAIIKGERYPGAAGRGQVHRSPPIAAAGTARVLFSLDI
jgi:hypothetical protein